VDINFRPVWLTNIMYSLGDIVINHDPSWSSNVKSHFWLSHLISLQFYWFSPVISTRHYRRQMLGADVIPGRRAIRYIPPFAFERGWRFPKRTKICVREDAGEVGIVTSWIMNSDIKSSHRRRPLCESLDLHFPILFYTPRPLLDPPKIWHLTSRMNISSLKS
jgi:hypothetical protein